MSLRGEMRQKGADIPSGKFAWMPAAMEENEAQNPGDVGLLRTPTMVARSRASSDLVKHSRRLARGSHRAEPPKRRSRSTVSASVTPSNFHLT